MGFLYREPGGESLSRKYILVVTSVIFSFLTSGVIFGFSGIYNGLLDAGAFADSCPKDQPPPCQIQHDRLTLMYTISASTISGIALPVGIFLDYFGPRITVCLGSLIFASGLVSLAIAARISDLLYFLGFFLFAVGGPSIFNSMISFGELFGESSAAVIGAQTGAFNSSSVVLFLMGQAIANWGFTLRNVMLLYTVVPASVFLVSLFLYPDRPFDSQHGSHGQGETFRAWTIRRKLLLDKLHRNAAFDALPPGISHVANYETPRASHVWAPSQTDLIEADRVPSREGSLRQSLLSRGDNSLPTSTGGTGDLVASPTASEVQSPLSPMEEHQLRTPPPRIYNVDFYAQVRSPIFWTMTAVTAALLLRINFYIATVYRQVYLGVISRQHPPDRKLAAHIAGEYTSLFNLILPLGGILMVPVVGYVLVNFGLVFSFAAVGVMNLVFCTVNLLEFLPHQIQLIGFMAFGATRPFVFSAMAAYIGRIFGFKHFGKLYGLCRLGGSFATSFSYPLVILTEKHLNHRYSFVNWGFLATGILMTVLFPLYLQSSVFSGFWMRPESVRGIDIIKSKRAPAPDVEHSTSNGGGEIQNV